jgi:hypothetical protein
MHPGIQLAINTAYMDRNPAAGADRALGHRVRPVRVDCPCSRTLLYPLWRARDSPICRTGSAQGWAKPMSAANLPLTGSGRRPQLSAGGPGSARLPGPRRCHLSESPRRPAVILLRCSASWWSWDSGAGCGSLRTLTMGDRFRAPDAGGDRPRAEPSRRERAGPSAAPSGEQRPSNTACPRGRSVLRYSVPANPCNLAPPVTAPVGAWRAEGAPLKP